MGRGVWDSCSQLVLSGGCPSTFLILSAAEEDLTSKKGHVGEIGNNFPWGKDSEVGVTWICRLSVPESARQLPGRAASSSTSPSSSGRSASASSDPRAPELLTPRQRAAIPSAPQRPGSRGRSLGSRAAGPAPPGPWGFSSCGAMGSVHTSRPLSRSTRRRGVQPSAHRSSPAISGHGPGGAARSSCLGGSEAGSAGAAASVTQGPGPHGVPTAGAARVGRAEPRVPSPGPEAAPGARGCEAREEPAGLAGAACRPPPPLLPGARSLPLHPDGWAPAPSRECCCSSERRLIDKEST